MVVRPTADMRLSFADGLFWSSVACCALAQFFILRSVREGGSRHVSEPAAAGVPQPRGMLEMVWAVVPALALAMLLMATWRAMHVIERAPSPPVTEAVR
jgi:heme/copper-type cytochrome/quinol oxidase subunit 2